MALLDAFAFASLMLVAFSLTGLIVVTFLPPERRKSLLHWLGRKWII